MALLEISPTGTLGRRIGAGAGIALAAALVLWLAAYFTGVFPWLGVAWQSRSWSSSGLLVPSGESSSGTEIGVSTFLFFKGQEIVVDYDLTVRAGSLWFYVYQPYDGELGDGVSHYVTATGKGVWRWRVPDTGIYHITIEPSVVKGPGRGYDLSYTAWWGAG